MSAPEPSVEAFIQRIDEALAVPFGVIDWDDMADDLVSLKKGLRTLTAERDALAARLNAPELVALMKAARNLNQKLNSARNSVAVQTARDGLTLAALAYARKEKTDAKSDAPYGQWCRDPAACKGKGYCPKDPTCGD